MHKNCKSVIFGAIVLLLSGVLVGCGNSAVQDIQLVVATSEAVVAALETTGTIPAPVATAVNVYMGQATEFVNFAITELASTDTPAVKASKIAAEGALLSKPDLPPGTPTSVATSIQAVASALAVFLANIQTAATAMRAVESPMVLSATEKPKPAKLKMSDSDKKKLEALKVRAEMLKARFPKK